MKHGQPCPRCDGRRIVHLAQVGDATDFGGTNMGPMGGRRVGALAPRHLAETTTEVKGLFGSTSTETHAACPTEAYVCASCGYVEEYVRDVADVDWSAIDGATVFEVEG